MNQWSLIFEILTICNRFSSSRNLEAETMTGLFGGELESKVWVIDEEAAPPAAGKCGCSTFCWVIITVLVTIPGDLDYLVASFFLKKMLHVRSFVPYWSSPWKPPQKQKPRAFSSLLAHLWLLQGALRYATISTYYYCKLLLHPDSIFLVHERMIYVRQKHLLKNMSWERLGGSLTPFFYEFTRRLFSKSSFLTWNINSD